MISTDVNPIDAAFRRLRSDGRKAFIPFMTAGDPNLRSTAQIIQELAERGADLIEIGFPYSDPIADGSVIQASYARALQRGLRIDDIFAWMEEITRSPWMKTRLLPFVAMVSYSLIYRRGLQRFVAQASAAGFSGAIIPDLPAEEAETIAQVASEHQFHLIQLITPTSPPARASRIIKTSGGFLYCVSVTGITGERDRLPEELFTQLRMLRQQTQLPLCVGFGISKADQVRQLRPCVDGIIVGSALVRRLERLDHQSLASIVAEIGTLSGSLVAALNAQ